jgi:hypothetical protein
MFRNTATAQRVLEQEQDPNSKIRILQENVTRWDSEFIALERLYNCRAEIISATMTLDQETQTFQVQRLDDNDWTVIAKLLQLLTPVRERSLRLQNREAGFSDTVVMMLTLNNEVLQTSNFDDEWVLEFKDTFRASIACRFKQYFLASDSLGVRACAVDHRYSHLSGITDESNIPLVKSWVFNEMKKYASSTQYTQISPPTPVAAMNGLISSAFLSQAPAVLQLDDALSSEFQDFLMYKSVDHNTITPLEFWMRYQARFPHVFKVAARFLVLQATSAESERTFSIADQVATGLQLKTC